MAGMSVLLRKYRWVLFLAPRFLKPTEAMAFATCFAGSAWLKKRHSVPIERLLDVGVEMHRNVEIALLLVMEGDDGFQVLALVLLVSSWQISPRCPCC